MAIYRVHRKLNRGSGKPFILPGIYPALDKVLQPDMLETLIERGYVSVASTPPLAELPIMERHVSVLERMGITTIEQFVDADPKTLYRRLRLKKKDVIELRELLINEYLTLIEDGRGCCR